MKPPAGRRRTRPWERSQSSYAAAPQDLLLSPEPEARETRFAGLVSRRARNLAIVAALPVIVILVAIHMFPSGGQVAGAPVAPRSPDAQSSVSPPPSRNPASDHLRAYAIAAPELQGLPVDAPAGTTFELWVSWEPPLTKSPRVHKLLDEVILEKVVPPVVPEAPHTAVLLVEPRQIADLLYGDRYGRLSALILRS